jgi:hypothetical protein
MKIRFNYLFLFIFILVTYLEANDLHNLWPEEAEAIILIDENEFNVISNKKAKLYKHRIIVVYNERGTEYGNVVINENKFIKCKNISGRILNQNGQEVKKIRKDEIYKANVSSSNILYDEDRYQRFEMNWSEYPYIIEYSYELIFSSLFYWPDWKPQMDIPVLKSTYKLILNKPIEYKTYSKNIKTKPEISLDKKNKTILWKLKNIEPVFDEPQIPPENKIQKKLMFAPLNFKLSTYEGSNVSWNDFAAWYRSLSKDKYILTEETIQQVQQLVTGIDNVKEKIQILYKFLQSHTHYVAIYLGIGGWQPHSAQSVFENCYGDCKDLSTLMIAMLKVVNIQAYPALVLTRNKGILIKEFPCNQFNHIIVFIPVQNDTIWLECTADYLPTGSLPSTDEGCDVLVVKDDCGEIIRTPKSTSNKNYQTTILRGMLNTDKDLELTGKITQNHNQCRRNMLNSLKLEKQKGWVSYQIGKHAPKYDLIWYKIDHLDNNYDKPLTIHFRGKINQQGNFMGNRLFINPNIINRRMQDDILQQDEERQFPVYYNYSFVDIDSVIILIPDGYNLEAAPDSLAIDMPFGSFNTSYSFKSKRLTYVRRLKLTQNIIPISMFDKYRAFIKSVIKNDKSNFVFVQK